MKTSAIIFPEPLRVGVGLAEIELPAPGPGQLLSRTLLTGVSTGTETRVWSGKQAGAVFPLVPGYENLGEVLQAGPGVDIPSGTRIFSTGSSFTGAYARWYGGQVAHALVEASEAVVIPADVDSDVAIYTKTAAIAYHGIQRGRVRAGETVVVVGQGLIGFLAAQVAKALGAQVIVIDPIEERLAAARQAGIAHTFNSSQVDVIAAVKELTGGGADVAVDVTGVAATVDQTARLLRIKPWKPPYPPSGRLVILGSYTDPVAFSYSPSLFDIEPDIYPSRDHIYEDMLAALDLLARGVLQTNCIPTLKLAYRQAAVGYQSLLERKVMRVLFDWSQNG